MSQQPQRRQPGGHSDEPTRYGDVLPVTGDLASQRVAPRDAFMMQAAERQTLGSTVKGGVASTMQLAADRNEAAGLVGHDDVSNVPAMRGFQVTENDLPGQRVVTESVGGQVVGQYVIPTQTPVSTPANGRRRGGESPISGVTVGEALEATAEMIGDKPVTQSDSAAIQAAEARVTGTNINVPGGVAAYAQESANANVRGDRFDDKTKIGDVLKNATEKLPGDKPVTREDAERVAMAELRNSPDVVTQPAGVAASMAAAARINQRGQA